MELVASTTFKKLAPKKGYVAPYLAFPWGKEKQLIGKRVNIFRVPEGYLLVTGESRDNKFKPCNRETNSCLAADCQIEQDDKVQTEIGNHNSNNSSNVLWARGLVGYDVALTRGQATEFNNNLAEKKGGNPPPPPAKFSIFEQ